MLRTAEGMMSGAEVPRRRKEGSTNVSKVRFGGVLCNSAGLDE
jgi:hypothetical protein